MQDQKEEWYSQYYRPHESLWLRSVVTNWDENVSTAIEKLRSRNHAGRRKTHIIAGPSLSGNNVTRQTNAHESRILSMLYNLYEATIVASHSQWSQTLTYEKNYNQTRRIYSHLHTYSSRRYASRKIKEPSRKRPCIRDGNEHFLGHLRNTRNLQR